MINHSFIHSFKKYWSALCVSGTFQVPGVKQRKRARPWPHSMWTTALGRVLKPITSQQAFPMWPSPTQSRGYCYNLKSLCCISILMSYHNNSSSVFNSDYAKTFKSHYPEEFLESLHFIINAWAKKEGGGNTGLCSPSSTSWDGEWAEVPASCTTLCSTHGARIRRPLHL